MQRRAAASRGLDVARRRPLLPVVRNIEDHLEAALSQYARDCGEIAAIRLDVADVRSKVVMIAPMENRDLMSTTREALDDGAADEQGAADDENAHARIISPGL